MLKELKRVGPGADVVEEWHETLTFLQGMERKSPDDPRWPLKIGKIFSVLGRKQESVEAMQRAARLHKRRGDTAQAVSACRQALEEDPNHEPALVMLTALLQDQLGQRHNGPSAYGPLPARAAPAHGAGHTSALSRVASGDTEIYLPEVQPGENRRITLDLEIPPRSTTPRRGTVVATAPGKGVRKARLRPKTVSIDDIIIVLDEDVELPPPRLPFRDPPRLANATEAPLDPGAPTKTPRR